MKIVCVGAGPASLYFAILMKAQDPAHEVHVYERNRLDDTFGFGVVFSDATMDNLEEADPPSYAAIRRAFYHWDDIDIHYRGEVLSSTGHGFAGLSRLRLLRILARRAQELGAELHFEREVDSLDRFDAADLIVLGDGVHSLFRERYAADFQPQIDERPNRFVWLGTTCEFPAFTFYFRENEHGLWRVHAYQYEDNHSTFIVECTDETFAASGLAVDDEEATVAYCEALFAQELQGHRLQKNRSVWRRFPTIRNARWHRDNMVLIGDAVHTAHFSVGSGTKLAMEDAIALRDALVAEQGPGGDAGLSRARIQRAASAYAQERKGPVESLQRAAQASLQWFEDTERYLDLEPVEFGFSLLTRSLRITHQDLQVRDPDYVARVDDWFAQCAET